MYRRFPSNRVQPTGELTVDAYDRRLPRIPERTRNGSTESDDVYDSEYGLGAYRDDAPLVRNVPPPPIASSTPIALKSVAFVVFAFLVIGLPLILTDPAGVVFPRSPAATPTSAPTSAPTNAVFATTTPFVYAVGGYYPGFNYVSMRWDASGTLYHPQSHEVHETIEACPVDECTILVSTNGTHITSPALRFPGFWIQDVHVNETHVAVYGAGDDVANSGWEIPGSGGITIERGHVGRAGLVILYTRTDPLEYVYAAMILQHEDSVYPIEMGKGDMDNNKLYVTYNGRCPDGEHWIMTPLVREITNSTDEDVTLSCSRHQAVVVIYTGDGLAPGDGGIHAVWKLEGPFDNLAPIVHVKTAFSEGPSYLHVFGVYGSDPDGIIPFGEGDNPEAFVLPNVAGGITPGEVPGVASPPGLQIDWTSDWPAMFLIRYDVDTYDFVDVIRHEIVARDVDTGFDGSTITMCGATAEFTDLHVFQSMTTNDVSVLTITDPDPTIMSPFCCEYGVDGALQECNIFQGSAVTYVTKSTPFVFTSLTAGNVQMSDDINVDVPDVVFEGTPETNMTLPSVADGISQSNIAFTYDDGALVYDTDATDRPGEYVYETNTYFVWYAVDGAVETFED